MKLEGIAWNDREQLAELFEAWLGYYTEEVVIKVMNEHFNEIITNEMVMNMLVELKERQEAEKKDRKRSFGSMIRNICEDGKIDNAHCLHNHCVTHANSYRDILYDLYIKERGD